MKKLCVLFLGVVMCVALLGKISSISSTSVKVNDGTRYLCNSDPSEFESADLGEIATLSLIGNINLSVSAGGASSAKMYYRVNNGSWLEINLDDKTTASAEGSFSEIETWKNSSASSVDISGLTNGLTYNLDVYFWVTEGTEETEITDPSEDEPESDYTATFTKIAAIDFTDGSGFGPAVSQGSTDQAIGRFYLSADVSGAALTAASVTLSGTRTGFSNIKLWSSADDVFDGSDTQLGTTIESDPGASPANFNDFTEPSAIDETAGTYYFVTADVASDATGSIRGSIEDDSDLTISSGSISQTLSSEPLSSSDLALPIELEYFTAEAKNGAVALRWQTGSETENAAFRIYRDDETIATMEGAGTTSEPQSYRWTDNYVVPDKTYRYVLADVDYQGKETKHPEVEVKVEVEEAAGTDFTVGSAYPNPFNPVTAIPLNLAKDADVHAQLFDLSGRPVQELHNGALNSGSHDLKISGKDLSTGIYVVHISVNNVLNVRKIALMK